MLPTPSKVVAKSIVHKISGRVAGLKPIYVAAIDQRLVDDVLGVSDRSQRKLRRRMNIIAPTEAERDRAIVATNLPYGLATRFLSGFFASYEVLFIFLSCYSPLPTGASWRCTEAYGALLAAQEKRCDRMLDVEECYVCIITIRGMSHVAPFMYAAVPRRIVLASMNRDCWNFRY